MDRRYDPSEFEAVLADDPGPRTGGAETRTLSHQIAGTLKISAGAQPPFDKFHALLENDDVARRTWERNRRDLKDGSASSYDLAMANVCVMARWTDQEIADTLIAMRRKHNQDLKLRHDYYGLTIAKARVGVLEEADVEAAYEAVEQALRGEEPEIAPLEAVNRILGTKIHNITLYVQEPPAYRVTLKDGRWKLFQSRHIAVYSVFELRYFELANEWPELKKGKSWKNIRRLIADHISRPEQQLDMGPEAREEGNAAEWIDSYLRLNRPAAGPVKGADVSDLPWTDGADVYIRANHFRIHVERREFLKLESKGVPRLLREAGLEPCVRRVGSTTRRYWCVHNWVKPEAGDRQETTGRP